MRPPHVLAIVQAGGAGGRLDVLTRERAKPSLPFLGVHRLVDFPLSNLVHSGVTEVWLSVQYLGSSLEERVSNGRPWDLDRTRGGLRLLMPQEGSGTADEEGFSRGNADELYRIRDQLSDAAPDLVLVLSADHVYRADLRDVIETHLASGATCTVVTTEVDERDAPDHAVVEVDDDGRVVGFEYKPDDPAGTTVAAEIFCYSRARLVPLLEELHRELGPDSPAGDTGLGDYGEHLVPRLVERGEVVAHPLPGYWRDLGQPHHYLNAHREFLTDDHDVLGDERWPILSVRPNLPPARVLEGAEVVDSVLSPGVRVSGRVVRSVLGPGVVVEPGAEVRDSVVHARTVVGTGATVLWSVVDRDCEVGGGARVGGELDGPPTDPDDVTLVGQSSRIGADAVLAGGARVEPGSDV